MKRALLAAWRRRRPVLMRGENWLGAMPEAAGPRGWARRAGLRALFALCDGFLTIGRANAAYYSRLGVAAERLFPMPYAVDNAAFAAAADAADRAALRARLGLPPGRPVVLFAGKLVERKHPHTLLSAWRRAFPGSGPARPLLAYVGDGAMAASLAAAAGDDPDVRVLGFRNQSEMPGLYTLADLFVLAAEREAWGLAINEAMAAGTAVVASDQCGAAFDLVDDDVGAVVPPGDVDALAAALARLLPRAGALGQAARRRVADWDFDADIRGLELALGWLRRRGGAGRF